MRKNPVNARKIPMTLLICSAFPPEIRDLQERGGKDWMTTTLGVGLVSAASSIAALLERHPISRILFTGTCGILTPSSISIGDIVRARTIYSDDIDSYAGANHIPDLMPATVAPTRFLAPRKPIQDCDVFSPLSITHSEGGAKTLRERFPDGITENLECFAVAWNAAQRGIPFEAVLGVTNTIGPAGHAEWTAHHEHTSKITQEMVYELI